MNILTLFLLATVLCALVLLAEWLWWAPARRRRAAPLPAPAPPRLVEHARALFPVLVLVLVVRAFLVEPFVIPSNSMLPTLRSGDFILVNKFAYGLRAPVFDTLLVPLGAPARGDVVVFSFPQDPSVDYIKRIVALPGDIIDYRDKVLYINDRPQPQGPPVAFEASGSAAEMAGSEQREEHLDGGAHALLLRPASPNLEPGCTVLAQGPLRVPPEHYFVLGDNRDASNDSRCFGLVPARNLRGRAFLVWMHFDRAHPGALPIDFARLGQRIR